MDDILGVTEANFKAQQMNGFLNVRSADKTLQFGPSKCKTMFVGRKGALDLSGTLSVDNWDTNYVDKDHTGKYDLVESFSGQIDMENVNEWKYLGFMISNSDSNISNIRYIKNKSIGTTRNILHRLNNLHLKRYFFEVGIIFKNIILRTSILYGSETYYNLTENETRQLERIEESYLRQLLSTPRSCPIVQIYLELGQYPARYEIKKLKLLFLKYILNQPENSTIYKFLQVQINNKTIKGDFASTCLNDLRLLRVNLSLEEIKIMKINQFKNILKSQIEKESFQYLLEKRKSKGSEVQYDSLQMSEYLLPNNYLNIDDQKLIFSLRNKMLMLYNDSYHKTELCICLKQEDYKHIYECQHLNKTHIVIEYDKIYNGSVKEQKVIVNRMRENLRIRKIMKDDISRRST